MQQLNLYSFLKVVKIREHYIAIESEGADARVFFGCVCVCVWVCVCGRYIHDPVVRTRACVVLTQQDQGPSEMGGGGEERCFRILIALAAAAAEDGGVMLSGARVHCRTNRRGRGEGRGAIYL